MVRGESKGLEHLVAGVVGGAGRRVDVHLRKETSLVNFLQGGAGGLSSGLG